MKVTPFISLIEGLSLICSTATVHAHAAPRDARGEIRAQVQRPSGQIRDVVAEVYGAMDESGFQWSHELGRGVIDARGRLSIDTSMTGIDKYRNPDGSITVQLRGAGVDEYLLRYVDLIQDPTGLWQMRDGQNETQRSSEIHIIAQAVPNAERMKVDAVSTSADALSPTSAAATAAASCSGGSAAWGNTGNTTRRMMGVQWYRSGANSTATYEWSNTNTTRLEAVAHLNGSSTGVSAGYVTSSTQSSGVSFSWPYNVSRTARVDWRYKQQALWCFNYQNQGTMTNQRRWVPEVFTGGNDSISSSVRFSCASANTVTASSPTWMARQTTSEHSVGGSFYGVNLKASQKNDSAHKMTIHPRSGTAARVCGNNNVPTLASLVREA